MEVKSMPMWDEKLQGYYYYFWDGITEKDILAPNGYRLETNVFERKFDAGKQMKQIMRKIEQCDKFYFMLRLDED